MLPGAADLARMLASIDANGRAQAEALARLTGVVERVVTQHLGDRIKSAPFFREAATSVPGGSSATVLTLTPPRSQSGVIAGWSICVESLVSGVSGWAGSPVSVDGLTFDVLRGGSPLPGLTSICSPPGLTGQLGPIWLPMSPDQPVSVRARNLDPVNSFDCLVQLAGWWSETSLGGRA